MRRFAFECSGGIYRHAKRIVLGVHFSLRFPLFFSS